MIRVMVVDDHAGLREFLIRSLAPEPDIEIVAVCADGQEAVDAVEQAAPEVILMDVSMPRMVTAQRLRSGSCGCIPELRTWLHTAGAHDPRVRHALGVGARGVVEKNSDLPTLLAAIRSS